MVFRFLYKFHNHNGVFTSKFISTRCFFFRQTKYLTCQPYQDIGISFVSLFPGESTFRCKICLAYSIMFYMIMNAYSYYVCSERMQFIRHSETSFDDLIYSVIHFLYVIPHFYLIPCHWKEVTKVGNYFAHWSEFQVKKIGI